MEEGEEGGLESVEDSVLELPSSFMGTASSSAVSSSRSCSFLIGVTGRVDRAARRRSVEAARTCAVSRAMREVLIKECYGMGVS